VLEEEELEEEVPKRRTLTSKATIHLLIDLEQCRVIGQLAIRIKELVTLNNREEDSIKRCHLNSSSMEEEGPIKQRTILSSNTLKEVTSLNSISIPHLPLR